MVEISAPAGPSVAEVVKNFLEVEGAADFAPGGVVIGPSTRTQQLAGCISIAQAPVSRPEEYTPTIRASVDILCQSPSVFECDKMQRHVRQRMHQLGRTLVKTVSNDTVFLIHFANVISGPHEGKVPDTDDIRQQLLVVDILVGTGDAEL